MPLYVRITFLLLNVCLSLLKCFPDTLKDSAWIALSFVFVTISLFHLKKKTFAKGSHSVVTFLRIQPQLLWPAEYPARSVFDADVSLACVLLS